MWIYQDKEITELPPKVIGFLYRITHLESGKWYIGRKIGTKSKITQSKGVKKKTKVDSDWRDYWSSSDILKEMVLSEGETAFKREILIMCNTKAEMLYGEEALLYKTDALFDENCLNSNIRAAIFRKWFDKDRTFCDRLNAAIS